MQVASNNPQFLDMANINSSQAIDWSQCLKLTGNRAEIADEMLAMFVTELPVTKVNIQQAYQAQDYRQMHISVHKLHGASCYCGVPRLKNLLAALETSLKTDGHPNLDKLMARLEPEIDSVISFYQTGNYKK